MKKKIISILMAYIGLTKAEAELYMSKLDDAEGSELDLDKLKADFEARQRELHMNDKEFIGKIQKDEAAKRRDMWINKLKKKSGVTVEEIKDKTDDEIVEMAFEKLRKKGDSTAEQLQQENVLLTAEIKKIREEELPAALKQVDAHKKVITIDAKLEKMVMNLPKKLRVGAIAAIATATAKLPAGYKIDLDDKGELTILTSEGLKPKSADGTKLLTASDILTEILDGEKLLENSGEGGAGGSGTGTGKKGENIIVDADDKKNDLYARYPHLKTAEENAARVKQDLADRKASGG